MTRAVKVEETPGQGVLQEQIVDLLTAKGPTSVWDIMKQLKAAKTTIYNRLTWLMNDGVVVKIPASCTKAGRPRMMFSLKQVTMEECPSDDGKTKTN